MAPDSRSPLLVVPALIAAALVLHTLMLAGWADPGTHGRGTGSHEPSAHAAAANDEPEHQQHLMAVGCVALAAAFVAPRLGPSSACARSDGRRLVSGPTARTAPASPVAAPCRDPVSSSVLLRI